MLPNLQKHNEKVIALHQRNLLQEGRVIVLKKKKAQTQEQGGSADQLTHYTQHLLPASTACTR